MPLNRAVRIRPALFSKFLVIWCLAAGCELFTSLVVVIIMSLGGELIRAASNSTAEIFTFVTEGWQSSRKKTKERGFLQPCSWGRLTPEDGAIDSNMRHVCTCILMAPPHQRTALGLHNEFFWGEMEQEVGFCHWGALMNQFWLVAWK